MTDSPIDLRRDIRPPEGSRIRYSAELRSLAKIHIPPRRFAKADGLALATGLFILGFMYFWGTGLTAGWSLPYSLLGWMLTAPGWLAGVGFAGGTFLSLRERQRIEVSSEGLRVEKENPFRTRRTFLPLDKIHEIAVRELSTDSLAGTLKALLYHRAFLDQQDDEDKPSFPLPVIRHAGGEVILGEFLPEPDIAWLVQTLNAVVARLRLAEGTPEKTVE